MLASFATTHGIVPALDPAEFDAIKRLIEATAGVAGVVAYKLGLTAALRLGLPEAVRQLRALTDLPLIYDHQKAGPDVPDMAAKFCAICAEAGVDGLILFPTAGPQAVAAFAGGALREGLLPIVGGDLPLPDYSVSGGGYVADDALPRIAAAAIAVGVDHFVVPANRPERIGPLARRMQEQLGRPPSLLLPGIGALGGSIGATFAAAPAGCRLYAVVGRAIYGAPDPAEAARSLAGEALAFA